MNSHVYTNGMVQLLSKVVDWANDTIKILLVDTNYSPNDAHKFVSDVSTYETTATNYSRKQLTNTTISTLSDGVAYKADPLTWSNLGGGVQLGGAIVYSESTTDADSPILAYLADSGFPTTADGTDLTMTFSSFGVIVITGLSGVLQVTAVSSVFGRTGDVVSASGDYSASQISVSPVGNIASTDVQGALSELDSEKVDNSDFTAPQYLLVTSDANLPNARVIVADAGVAVVDSGTNLSVKLANYSPTIICGEEARITDIPSAATEISIKYRVVISLRFATDIRMFSTVTATGVGNIYLEYSTNAVSWNTLTTNQIGLSVAGTAVTGWEAVPSGAKQDTVYIRLMSVNGDGVSDPRIGVTGFMLR